MATQVPSPPTAPTSPRSGPPTRPHGDRALRDQLILHYSPLVKYVAGRVAVGPAASVDRADLVSYGIFGLIDAIERFDAGAGVPFETYAIGRIKGAIVDELRSLDWVPRSVRAKARAVEAAYQSSRPACTGCPPTTSWPRAADLSRRAAPDRAQPDLGDRPRRARRGHRPRRRPRRSRRGPGGVLEQVETREVLAAAVKPAARAGARRCSSSTTSRPDAGRDRRAASASPRAGSRRSTPRPCSTSAPAWPPPSGAAEAPPSAEHAPPGLAGSSRCRRPPRATSRPRPPTLPEPQASAAMPADPCSRPAGLGRPHRRRRRSPTSRRSTRRSSTTSGRPPARGARATAASTTPPRPGTPVRRRAGGVVTFAGPGRRPSCSSSSPTPTACAPPTPTWPASRSHAGPGGRPGRRSSAPRGVAALRRAAGRRLPRPGAAVRRRAPGRPAGAARRAPATRAARAWRRVTPAGGPARRRGRPVPLRMVASARPAGGPLDATVPLTCGRPSGALSRHALAQPQEKESEPHARPMAPSSPCASCSRPASTSGTRPVAGTRR